MEWEYLIAKEPDGFNAVGLSKWLESYGKQGWELCSVLEREQIYIFKKQNLPPLIISGNPSYKIYGNK
jgi:hypothetical protein